MTEPIQNQEHILNQLSAIRESLAINTTETANIKSTIGEIKDVIKIIQSDFVNRREFNEALITLREEISPLKKFVYGVISVLAITVFAAIINMVLK